MNDYPTTMPSEPNDEIREVEQALARLRPSAPGIDRDRLMFMAGQASARAIDTSQTVAAVAVAGPIVAESAGLESTTANSGLSAWLWPSATAISTLAAAVLGILLAISHRPLVVREQVYIHPPTPSQPVNTPQGQERPPGMLVTGSASDGSPGMQPDITMAATSAAGRVADGSHATIAEADFAHTELGQVDLVPRTSPPAPSYVHHRQVAIALGVDALGSGPASGVTGGARVYRTTLKDLVRGAIGMD